MTIEKLHSEDLVNNKDKQILNKIRKRADDLINLGFLQTRMWMITTGIAIIAATYGIEFSVDMVRKFNEKKKSKNL